MLSSNKSIDSFEFLLNQLAKDLRVVNENLELVGLFYIGKVLLKSLVCLTRSFTVYGLPRLISNEAWIRSHGKWAILNGCTSQNGIGFAVELARRKFNLILIGSNKILSTKLADFLAEEYRIKTICFEPNSISRLIYDLDVLKEVGLLKAAYFHTMDQNCLNEQILLNVNIPIALSRAVLPSMLSRKRGLIVFVTSTSAQLPTAFMDVQESSAAAYLEKFAESIRFEYGAAATTASHLCIQCVRMSPPTTTKVNSGRARHHDDDDEANANVPRVDDAYLRNQKNFAHASRALALLGWSDAVTVSCASALKIYLFNSIPRFLFNPVYVSALRRSFFTQIS